MKTTSDNFTKMDISNKVVIFLFFTLKFGKNRRFPYLSVWTMYWNITCLIHILFQEKYTPFFFMFFKMKMSLSLKSLFLMTYSLFGLLLCRYRFIWSDSNYSIIYWRCLWWINLGNNYDLLTSIVKFLLKSHFTFVSYFHLKVYLTINNDFQAQYTHRVYSTFSHLFF